MRGKLLFVAGETPMIHTVRGVGYVIKPTS
ncbi:response regulator transcription factor [Bacillus sp. S34]|nr:response regulator transcription factor [Bacillus sp. S34]